MNVDLDRTKLETNECHVFQHLYMVLLLEH